MKMFRRLVAACALSVISVATQAAPITIDFDTDLGGNPVANRTLLNSIYSGLGVTFNATALTIVGAGGVTSQPNFATGDTNFLTSLEVTFDTFATSIAAANVTNSFFTLTAFDIGGNVLGSVNSVPFPGIVSLSGIGEIKRATFSSINQYGIDDLTFDTVKAAAVPEPGSFALMGLGFLGLAASLRKLKKSRNA